MPVIRHSHSCSVVKFCEVCFLQKQTKSGFGAPPHPQSCQSYLLIGKGFIVSAASLQSLFTLMGMETLIRKCTWAAVLLSSTAMSPPVFPRPTTKIRLPRKVSGILYSWLCRICPLNLWIPEGRKWWTNLKYLHYTSAVHMIGKHIACITTCSKRKQEEQLFLELNEL